MYPPFDMAREGLERQFENIKFEPNSGLTTDELLSKLRRHRRVNPKEPRILTRAWLFHLICSEARIAIDAADYFIGKIEHGDLLAALRNEWLAKEVDDEFKNDKSCAPGAFSCRLDLSHTCPDWRNLLKYGVVGLRDRVVGRSGVFYEAVTHVYDGIIILIQRFNVLSPDSALAALDKRPPQTFQEALQLAYLYHELQEMEGEPIRSMGRFDLLYYEYFMNDIKAGRLTHEYAKELLKYYWIKFYAKDQGKAFGKPFLFGPDVNELSYLSFETFREMRVVDPKFHVRLSQRTPVDFIDEVLKCITIGCNSIVIVNNDKQVEMLCRHGRSLKDAEDYILIGCYEPAIMGKEMNCSGASEINLARCVEMTLASNAFDSFDEFMKGYLKTIDSQFTIAADRTRRYETLWSEINPSPLLSGTMDACVEAGLDVSEAGAKYNVTGCVALGLANAVDSLAVIRQLVYDEKYCSLEKLKSALTDNWCDFEELRQVARNRVAKWGNDDEDIDKIALEITDFLGPRINNEPNARGGFFHAALYGILTRAEFLGSLTGALPDGRLACEPLSINTGANPGMDREGVTSLINSVTKIDLCQFPSGTVLDIIMHPSAVVGDGGRDILRSLVRSHFTKGGMAIQFNIFDASLLSDAKQNPEKYASLQIRVCGWSVKFVDLSPEEQDLFIAKSTMLPY